MSDSVKEQGGVLFNSSLITDHDIYLFKQGSHFRLYDKLGAHPLTVDGVAGFYFAVWAPNAERLSVVGDFNGWNPESHCLAQRWDGSGIHEGFIPGVKAGDVYKYHLVSRVNGFEVDKTDPYAFLREVPPATASVAWDLDYQWDDQEWLDRRGAANALGAPHSLYEVHPGSWRRDPNDPGRFLSYRELARELPAYAREMGFTHIEFMPLAEHPFYGSWGYQVSGYFAPSSRYGTPQDLMYLIDQLHQHGIGVVIDWVPSHFPADEHGLVFFDGTHLYEHADPKKGFHPDWGSYIFNYGRNEVRSFLVSNAIYWLEKFHIDGIRIDAVASMLYLDYSRKEGEWIPNQYGGRENIEALTLLQRLNEVVYEFYPDTQTIAEESTAWPMVTRPAYIGGLGFGFKWNMGWMHDTLEYMSKEPIYRKYHHNQLTFSIWYTFYENFVLSLSHDEVVYGKGSLLAKMPGDDWQKFANLRLLFGYMFGHPGKKLLFMGGEFGQWNEWYHETSLDWHLLAYEPHQGLQKWVQDLNHYYRSHPPLYERDYEQEGFEWMDVNDWESSAISFIRRGRDPNVTILVVCNFTPVVRQQYRVAVPAGGFWNEALNSDATIYGGSGQGNLGGVTAEAVAWRGKPHSLSLTLPPLGVLFFEHTK
jgi:1,4-alpha-glucan branching enzyme